MTGELHNARFSGTLTHRDGQRPISVVTGTVAARHAHRDDRALADVRADSLSFDGLRGSYPGLRLRGTVSGPITLDGTLAALESHADLESSAGAVQLDGVLTLLESRSGVRDFSMRGQNIDLARWVSDAPHSNLTFMLTGDLTRDNAAPPVGAFTATLAASRFVGVALDTGHAALHFAGRPGVRRFAEDGATRFATRAAAVLGWEHPAGGVLSLDVKADNLNALDSLVTWLVGEDTAAQARARSLRGAGHLSITLDGALDSLTIEARGTTQRLRWRDWEVPAGEAHLVYQPGPVPGLRFDAKLDSLRFRRLAVGAPSATIRGTRDSLTWFARSRFGDVGQFVAGGRMARTSRHGEQPAGTTVGIDSLSLQLPWARGCCERPSKWS